jgi:hypothetical protein
MWNLRSEPSRNPKARKRKVSGARQIGGVLGAYHESLAYLDPDLNARYARDPEDIRSRATIDAPGRASEISVIRDPSGQKSRGG